jgi:two-component system, NarL family, response regulator NreC
MRPRVILADDHAIVAEGVGRLISEVAELIDQVGNGSDLVRSARQLRPDIIVSDVTMPGMSGLEAMRQLKSEGIEAKFIFLTIHKNASLAVEAFRSGATAFLLKQAAGEELLAAIRAAVTGGIYVTPLLAGEVLKAIAHPEADPRPLTSRQIEVLRLIAQGRRMKEIAAELNISVRTVEDHRARLLQMLDAGGTAELVRFAIKQGLIPE